MSMSTLGNQLSALSSANTSKSGFAHSSSRANDDAVGRGFHHSNKHGHSLLAAAAAGGGGDVTRRPSVLYDNAREAAEVSTVTLRENAVAAVGRLSAVSSTSASIWKDEEFIGARGLLSVHNLNNFERGTATSQRNLQIDKSIERLLILIMTMVNECPPPAAAAAAAGTGDNNESSENINSNPVLLSTLQIIEYLLRQYSIHTRPATASMLLQTFLPFDIVQQGTTTSYPAIYSRLVSLIDLQTIPEWTFLRPHAARGAPPLGRGGLAKRVARDDALAKIVGDVGKRGMEVWLSEEKARNIMGEMMQVGGEDGGAAGRSGAVFVRRGISTLISSSASVLVEALHIQSSSRDAGISGGIQESTVRAIFPLVLSACKSTGSGDGGEGGMSSYCCPEWKEWGRILASTLAMLCPLSMDVKSALCEAIADGLPSVSGGGGGRGGGKRKLFREAVDGITGGDNSSSGLSVDEADDATSAIMTLLSVLGAMDADDGKDDDDGSWGHYLPMLPPTKNRRNGSVIDYMGCELPLSTYKLISTRAKCLPKAIGATILQSLGNEDRSEDEEDESAIAEKNSVIMERMAPLLASVIMHAFRRLEKEAGKILPSTSSSPASQKKKRKSKGGTKDGDESAAVKFKADRDVLLILSLIKEPSLSSLWSSKNSAFVAAVTVRTITSYKNLYESSSKPSTAGSSAILERYASILKALSTTNSSVHDQGVAYAINIIAKSDEGCSKEENESRMSCLAKLLGRDDILSLVSQKDASKRNAEDTSAEEQNSRGVAILLPPRVALEDADASVRLDAISRLKASIESDDVLDDDLGHALLRRLAMDDDMRVATAAGEIVASQLMEFMGGKGDEMDVDGSGQSFASQLVDDLDNLAKVALAALTQWTLLGKGSSWSPVALSGKKGRKKKAKKKSKGKEDSSVLLSCISICGSVAKLILEEESIESIVGNDSDESIAQPFCMLFLSLGAHVNTGSYTTESENSHLVDEASEAASSELLSLLNDEATAPVSLLDLITTHPVSQKVLAYFFSGGRKEEAMKASKVAESRFLWFALHSFSEVLASPSSKKNKSDSDEGSAAILQVALDLTLYQIHSYTKESKQSSTFEWEAQFLSEICKRCLSSLASDDRDGFEKAMMKLATTLSGLSFDEIVKPAIASQLDSKNTLGVTALMHSCLQPNASNSGISRILDIVKDLFGGKRVNPTVARDCIIPSFALLSHPEREIRKHVIELLEQCQSIKKDEMLSDICSKATDKSSPLRSSLVMDGANTLPSMLGQIVLSSKSAAPWQKFLIENCKSCALNGNESFSLGGCQASAIILSAMEKGGENAFPLSKRWDLAGKELFQSFLKYDQADKLAFPSLRRLRDCVLSMLKGVMVNEAQAGDDGLSIQISIGPSQSGRRLRSYSVGASESFSTLQPYPESMLKAILEALSSSSPPLLLSKHVVQLVIVRPSWANGVFPKLTNKSKNAVATALLSLRTQHNDELAGSALLGLPLKSSDFFQLLKEVDASQSEIDQAAVAFITDCVRGKLDVLGSTADISKLSSKIFDQLRLLSSVKNSSASESDSGSRDYTRVTILQTLFSIHLHHKSQLSKPPEKEGRRKRSRSHSDVGTPKEMASQADLLVGLVGGNPMVIHPLNSGRGRALSLSLLTCLCEESPTSVVTSLLPALMSLAETSPTAQLQGKFSTEKVDMKALGDALVAIVPAYCTHAPSANLSLFNLLECFVGRIIVPNSGNEKSRYSLLDHLVDALKLLPTKESSSDAIASLAACAMALQAFNLQKIIAANDYDSQMPDADDDSQPRLDQRVLANTTRGVRIAVSLSLLQYAERLMSFICGRSEFSTAESSGGKMKVDISEVAALALRGSNTEDDIPSAVYSNLSEAQQRSLLYLSINLLQSVRDALSTPEARRVVRKSRGEDADTCLCLWNEMMQTHTNTLRANARLQRDGRELSSMEKKFWAAAPIATGECLENLQNLLPVPHFLASVSSSLGDESVDAYIRKKSIRLLADRVVEVNADSPEASLFLETVPDLVAQVNIESPTARDVEGSLASARNTIVIQQGALVAIESFARSLYPPLESGKLAGDATAVFLPALESVTSLMNSTASSWILANEKGGDDTSSSIVDAECQLLSSSSLCVSALVTTLKARCLPMLPSIIKPLVTSLKSANVLIGDTIHQASSSGELLQLSILRTLKTIAETLPQFLPPYLLLIFSSNALPSRALRQGNNESDHSVRGAALQVETILATKVKTRQLIPALTQALSKLFPSNDSANWEEACSIINVMKIAVESAQRSDLSPIVGKIFNGLVMAYGYEGDELSRPKLLQNANGCLLSLVMKLSEAQLRPLYSRFREWRGDIEEGSMSSVRRYAFWSLSAQLSKSLRSIFLPCLTSVLTDVIDELELAVSSLCQGNKKTEGSKRRRLEENDGSIENIGKVKPLQPLLLCLEFALKADAHEGGDWTRGDDNQRYNMILNHLGKLLMAQVPSDICLISDLTPKEESSTSAYQQLVQGVGTIERGNVVGCLTALAAAAGNEQLWKSLNFAVLEACGHKRAEVRRAAISCLLSIIETIGEEYMVLLPECLPVLSELLEDDDVEIAGAAKECVRQGEELLGESLEDSLR